VQGIGFRPFVYRLARHCRLGGCVRNMSAGILIELEGPPEALTRFRERLVLEAPPAAQIDEVLAEPIAPSGRSLFTILISKSSGPTGVRVPRDLSICSDCRCEIFDHADRRRNYPFTNCTACGPRYSIIEAMPYDRCSTAMRLFAMCSACANEYHSPGERRFHAQPNACATCGPQIGLWDPEGRVIARGDTVLVAATALLRRGQIVALKGLGGFQLIVRADQANAVKRLRQRKQRASKPLAVMIPSLADAKRLAELDPAERHQLNSPQNPIVLASMRPGALPADVAPRVGTVGLFLPTTPLHHLLLAEFGSPVVATSGNRSEDPIVTEEREAIHRLRGVADAFLVHDRPIIRGIDDSVVQVIAGQPTTLRLARGMAPLPLPALEAFAKKRICPPILATGGHQKNALAIWTGSQAILAQHIGDLDNSYTRTVFRRVTLDLGRLYQFEPIALACDMHPDYFTTQWAFMQNKPVARVQHHHAHALACMAEHNLLDREVLALTWDGTGYGPDGTIWGGEVLRAECTGFQRLASLLPFPLPGGEQAIRRPNRAAFGLLWLLLGEEAILRELRLLRLLGLQPREAGVLTTMIHRSINTPWTSSMGRLFDAVAALVLGVHKVSYEGEAAIWLQAIVDSAVTDAYSLPLRLSAGCEPMVGDRTVSRGDWRPVLSSIVADLMSGIEAGVVAARFHNALANWAAEVASRQPLREVVLSGGCFQNRILAEQTLAALSRVKCRGYLHNQIPPGDGGLAVGQLAAAIGSTTDRRFD
jgi:hydrogenase maturation protein HypF